jgi:hypothetical protein
MSLYRNHLFLVVEKGRILLKNTALLVIANIYLLNWQIEESDSTPCPQFVHLRDHLQKLLRKAIRLGKMEVNAKSVNFHFQFRTEGITVVHADRFYVNPVFLIAKLSFFSNVEEIAMIRQEEEKEEEATT